MSRRTANKQLLRMALVIHVCGMPFVANSSYIRYIVGIYYC
jgi:hypothetical protein